MKILVTGGSGFIGSAVIRLALQRGHSIVNLDALTYAASEGSLSMVANDPRYCFVKADIRERQLLTRIFTDHKPDCLMHLAAESHVDRSIDGPGAFIDTNILGTYNLLEAARKFWVNQGKPTNFLFHHVSTDEVYGSLGVSGLFTEETAYNPRSPYSASKAASDHLVQAWHHTFGMPVLLTNCSNNYGPYQFPEKLIPVTIINALNGQPIPIYGTGANIRDWLYVEDHAEALLTVLERANPGEYFNIGGNNEASNIELVISICRILDRFCPQSAPHDKLITFVTDRPGHDYRYAIDASHIQDRLGWRPSVTLQEGLERTVRWYLNNEHWWRPLLGRDGVGHRLGTQFTKGRGI